MAAVSGRMGPRVPLDRCPARSARDRGSGRRDAALLCSAGAFRRGAMMGCGERLGSVVVGVGEWGSVGWARVSSSRALTCAVCL